MKQLFQAIFILLLSVGLVFAQGEDAGVNKNKKSSNNKKTTTKNTTKKTTSKTIKTTTKTTATKNVKVKKTTKSQSNKEEYASLTITVNEAESRILLTNADGDVLEEDPTTGDKNEPLIIDDLPIGNYKLRVSKNGFPDEERQVSIVAGKMNNVSVAFKAVFGFLSVAVNVDGANIEIENVGEFENRVENLQIAPGNYRVNVYKDGYQTGSQQVSINAAGQRGAVNIELQPIIIPVLMSDAQTAFAQQNYQETIKICRRILAAEPTNAAANLLAGLSFFKTQQSRSAVFPLSRALGSNQTFALPVRVFGKSKNDLQLLLGNLTFARGNLQFTGTDKSDADFKINAADVAELNEKSDEFGMMHVELRAKGSFRGKKDTRLISIYPPEAIIRGAPKQIACANCDTDFCLCKMNETAMFELLSRWRKNDFTSQPKSFGAVMLPSNDFAAYRVGTLSIKVPVNWQTLTQTDTEFLAAPLGGFFQADKNILYSHGVNVAALPNPNNLNLNALTDTLLNNFSNEAKYLTRGVSARMNLRGMPILINKFSGLSPDTGRSENVTFYTLTAPRTNSLIVLITVAPPDEADEYEATFRRIIGSLQFSNN